MAQVEVNRTIEDYLRSMYRLQMRDGRASNAALAKELAVSSAAVTDMVRRLSEQGLIEYEKYQGALLTRAGMNLAMSVTRRHRLWEVFLIQQLNFDWDEVHDLADELEHISSEKLIDRLDTFLGHPTHDPHGDPIPTKEGVVPSRSLVPIAELEPGESGRVERVSDEFPELLRYAASVGLSIKAHIKVLEKISFDCSVRLEAEGRESVVSEKLASSVFVAREAKAPRQGRRQ
jgi:DtxR family Mn-dependent transcriptional regulator